LEKVSQNFKRRLSGPSPFSNWRRTGDEVKRDYLRFESRFLSNFSNVLALWKRYPKNDKQSVSEPPLFSSERRPRDELCVMSQHPKAFLPMKSPYLT